MSERKAMMIQEMRSLAMKIEDDNKYWYVSPD